MHASKQAQQAAKTAPQHTTGGVSAKPQTCQGHAQVPPAELETTQPPACTAVWPTCRHCQPGEPNTRALAAHMKQCAQSEVLGACATHNLHLLQQPPGPRVPDAAQGWGTTAPAASALQCHTAPPLHPACARIWGAQAFASPFHISNSSLANAANLLLCTPPWLPSCPASLPACLPSLPACRPRPEGETQVYSLLSLHHVLQPLPHMCLIQWREAEACAARLQCWDDLADIVAYEAEARVARVLLNHCKYKQVTREAAAAATAAAVTALLRPGGK